ncbi:MAG: hypothetical protein R6V10_10215 [bacterium]
MRDKLAHYFRSRVEVKAQGILYRGFLVGADEDFLYLIGETMYLTIPMENVTSVRREEEGEKDWLKRRIEGEKPPEGDEKESKRRYARKHLKVIHSAEETDETIEAGGEPAVSHGPDSPEHESPPAGEETE